MSGAMKNQLGWLDLVQQQVASLRFGVVQIVVHESRVVQVEMTQKIRLDAFGPVGDCYVSSDSQPAIELRLPAQAGGIHNQSSDRSDRSAESPSQQASRKGPRP